MPKVANSLPKEGDVIENYQGRFAKVVSAKDSRFGLSAWVIKKEDAKEETKAVRFLNTYGLAQVIKGEGDSTYVPEATEAPAEEPAAEEKPKKAKK